MKSYKPFSGFCAIIIAIALPLLGGESSYAQDRTKIDPLCFIGNRFDHCKSFIILETGLKFLVTGHNRRPDKAGFLLTGDIGWMKNTSMKNAFGFSFYGAADDDGARIGIRPRFRRWLSRRTALDLSAGIIFSGTDNKGSYKSPGFVASASLGVVGWFSVDAHLETIKLERTIINRFDQTVSKETSTDVSLYLGASGHHYVGIALSVVTFIAAKIAYGSVRSF